MALVLAFLVRVEQPVSDDEEIVLSLTCPSAQCSYYVYAYMSSTSSRDYMN